MRSIHDNIKIADLCIKQISELLGNLREIERIFESDGIVMKEHKGICQGILHNIGSQLRYLHIQIEQAEEKTLCDEQNPLENLQKCINENAHKMEIVIMDTETGHAIERFRNGRRD